jgi:hypothetical protein
VYPCDRRAYRWIVTRWHFVAMDGRIRPTRTWHSGVVHVGVDVVVGVVLDGDGDGDWPMSATVQPASKEPLPQRSTCEC